MSLESKAEIAALRARLAALPAEEAQALAVEVLGGSTEGSGPEHNLWIRSASVRAQLEELPIEARQKLFDEFLAGPPGRLEDFLRTKDLRGIAAKCGPSDAVLAKHLADARAQYETLSAPIVTLVAFAGAYLSNLGIEMDDERIEKALKR